jgi:flagellar hook-basal body complex protein FliE
VRAIDGEVRGADPDRMAKDLLSGEIQGFHEVAARINRARISFEFAMEVRNKLIDAYRETMRMTL